MAPGILVVENLNVTIEGRRIVSNVNLQLGPGVHSIVGPNGAGKTTLLKAILGLVPTSGRIVYDGRRLDPAEAAYSPATPIVDQLALVEDVLRAGVYNSRGGFEDAVSYLRRLGLQSYIRRRYSSLSSGEQRLVWIARTLGRRARLVLLDEPLSFLDVRNQSVVLRMLREYSRINNAVVILTTHEIHYIWYFDTVSVMNMGRILYTGPPEGLDKEVLEETYGVELRYVKVNGMSFYVPFIEGD